VRTGPCTQHYKFLVQTVKTLTVCAAREPERFAHAAPRARNDREERRLLADAYAHAHAREQGIALLQTDPDGDQDTGDAGAGQYPGTRALTELRPRIEDPFHTRLTAGVGRSRRESAATQRRAPRTAFRQAPWSVPRLRRAG
jgi:hypothetical protein